MQRLQLTRLPSGYALVCGGVVACIVEGAPKVDGVVDPGGERFGSLTGVIMGGVHTNQCRVSLSLAGDEEGCLVT